MSLAKRLFIKLDKPISQDRLEVFVALIRYRHPRLENLIVHLDLLPWPMSELLRLAETWHRSKTRHKPKFVEVGSWSVETDHGFRLSLCYARAHNLVQHITHCNCEDRRRAHLERVMVKLCPALAASAYGEFEFWTFCVDVALQ